MDEYGSGFPACMELPCLSCGGLLWSLVWQGGQGQEWFSWVWAVLLLVGVEEPIFPMWSGAPGQRKICTVLCGVGVRGLMGFCGCPESWSTHGWVGGQKVGQGCARRFTSFCPRPSDSKA